MFPDDEIDAAEWDAAFPPTFPEDTPQGAAAVRCYLRDLAREAFPGATEREADAAARRMGGELPY